jgi:hypothetical protein
LQYLESLYQGIAGSDFNAPSYTDPSALLSDFELAWSKYNGSINYGPDVGETVDYYVPTPAEPVF